MSHFVIIVMCFQWIQGTAMKDWFIYIRQNIFNHEGRARRSEFVWFQIMNVLSQIVFLSILIGIILITFPSNLYLNSEPYAYFVVGVLSLLFIYQLWMFLVYLGVTTRRLHDLGCSGWWQLPLLLPAIIILILFIPIVLETEFEIEQLGFLPFMLILSETTFEIEQLTGLPAILMGAYGIFALVMFGILFFKDGQFGPNKYGDAPKEK